ncbi:MAG: hypothetical protein CM15mP12_1060 [Gammaproteobacteria bacterium]|nr:MAG: hypothetical protein CM15mP12_1060 [Gammaproteobacteria bacterium]
METSYSSRIQKTKFDALVVLREPSCPRYPNYPGKFKGENFFTPVTNLLPLLKGKCPFIGGGNSHVMSQ